MGDFFLDSNKRDWRHQTAICERLRSVSGLFKHMCLFIPVSNKDATRRFGVCSRMGCMFFVALS